MEYVPFLLVYGAQIHNVGSFSQCNYYSFNGWNHLSISKTNSQGFSNKKNGEAKISMKSRQKKRTLMKMFRGTETDCFLELDGEASLFGL